MNISQHCIFRFATRMYDEVIKDDNTFKLWKKDNQDKVQEIQKEILNSFNNPNNIKMVGLETKKDRSNHYKVDIENKWIFVYDENTIITCFEIKYDGISYEASEVIINALIDDYNLKLPELQKIQSEYVDLLDENAEKMAKIESEKKLYRKKIEELDLEIKELQNSIDLKKANVGSCDYELRLLVEKIVKSKSFI